MILGLRNSYGTQISMREKKPNDAEPVLEARKINLIKENPFSALKHDLAKVARAQLW